MLLGCLRCQTGGADSRRGCLRAGSSGPAFDRSGWQSIHPDADSHAMPAHPQPLAHHRTRASHFGTRLRPAPKPRRLRRPGSPHSKQRKPAPVAFQANSHSEPIRKYCDPHFSFPLWEDQPQTTRLRRPGSPHSKRKKPIPATFQANSDVGPSDSTPALSPGPFRNAPPDPQPKPDDYAGQVHPTASS